MPLSAGNEDWLTRRAQALSLDPYSPITPTMAKAGSARDPLGLSPYSPFVGPTPHPKKGLNSCPTDRTSS